ncbi:hypothetical protein [Corynebacterium liangguodongii]|uniref:Uncharacterized protein n=1 Tax=Corynebacterium liangguodongii TaxID=2079535 RepID=A0A2S0WCJ0_9CORY|nr:hypothetical protein [Corynebacterium liangguodongii]AWB83489.1 hypothetical protein C3E79_02440 [Corynebacterium liangguodongii]PWC00422.1 hypothetical protein DF219_00515 [Corynebacterium liangguodongii]
MSTRAIYPVKLSLSGGDFYTLWAPTWTENGTQWQAFLGDDSSVMVFASPAAMLAYLDSGRSHDLSSHPSWARFSALGDVRVVPEEKNCFDIVGAPAYLAGRPSHENVSRLSRVFAVSRSLAAVAAADEAQIFFASHSILGNADRGSDHFAGENGMSEWTGIGRVVLANWESVVHSLDGAVRLVDPADSDGGEAAVDSAAQRISAAQAAREEERARAAAEQEKAAAAADPYDSSIWGLAGIDPIKISAQGKSAYTLRTYLGSAPVFLGKYGEIFTFPSPKHLVRWIVENDDHDLAGVSTWPDVLNAAHAGELEVTVHPDNSYSLTGISADIDKGPDAVDTAQMSKAYEIMADAADWAKDDSLNSLLLANPRMQDYLSYMLGSTNSSGYVPTAPFTDKAQTWKEMEEQLVGRFSKF